MTTKYFNFNNEQELFPIDVDDNGAVVISVDGAEAHFNSVQEFAENYAIARNVLPENLKNWTLTNDDDTDTFSFVLQAGTAGLDTEELVDLVSELRNTGLDDDSIVKIVQEKLRSESGSKSDSQDDETNESTDNDTNELTDDEKRSRIKNAIADLCDDNVFVSESQNEQLLTLQMIWFGLTQSTIDGSINAEPSTVIDFAHGTTDDERIDQYLSAICRKLYDDKLYDTGNFGMEDFEDFHNDFDPDSYSLDDTINDVIYENDDRDYTELLRYHLVNAYDRINDVMKEEAQGNINPRALFNFLFNFVNSDNYHKFDDEFKNRLIANKLSGRNKYLVKRIIFNGEQHKVENSKTISLSHFEPRDNQFVFKFNNKFMLINVVPKHISLDEF